MFNLTATVNFEDDEKDETFEYSTLANLEQTIGLLIDANDEATSFVFTVVKCSVEG